MMDKTQSFLLISPRSGFVISVALSLLAECITRVLLPFNLSPFHFWPSFVSFRSLLHITFFCVLFSLSFSLSVFQVEFFCVNSSIPFNPSQFIFSTSFASCLKTSPLPNLISHDPPMRNGQFVCLSVGLSALHCLRLLNPRRTGPLA